MLVLTRRLNETIVIGNNIRVSVVSIGPGRVKIGIEAPDDVRIDREEIHARIVEEQATGTAPVAKVDEAPHAADAPKFHNRISSKLPVEVAIPVARAEHLRKPR